MQILHTVHLLHSEHRDKRPARDCWAVLVVVPGARCTVHCVMCGAGECTGLHKI